MKKKIAGTVTAIALSISISTTAFAVGDIENHWGKSDINYLIDNKIMSGYTDDTFKPDNKITRAEFLKIVNNVYENEEIKKIEFDDVKEKDWFYEDIAKAVASGYTEGYTDNTFRPNDPVNRQEASKIIVMASKLEGSKINKRIDFKDKDEINKWAQDFVDIMVEKGYIKGYEDNSFRPKRNLSRAEAAKILSEIKQEIELDKKIAKEKEEKEKEEKEKEEQQKPLPEVKPVYSVQIKTFKEEKEALALGTKLLKDGYKDTFIARDNYNIYYVIAKDFELRVEAEKIKLDLERKGYEPIISKKDFKEYEIIKPKTEQVVETNLTKFITSVEKLPEAKSIDKLTEKLLIDIDGANNLYKKISDVEKEKIAKKDINKLKAVEEKVNSMKTNIESETKTSSEKAQEWAKSRGAHERFINIAPSFWEYGKLTGINPEILYAQAAKETNFGKYTGSVKPEMNNWAGIKTNNPSGDKTYDHEIFESPEEGVRAQFNHMGIYVGVDPIGEPHPRWHVTSKVSWKGTVKKVEDLGGKWAPSRDYGISIMRDYVNQIYKF